MKKLRLVDLLQLEEDNMLKLKEKLQEIGLQDNEFIQDTLELIDLVINLKQTTVKIVDCEMRRRKTTEEKAVSLAVSEIQKIAVIYDIDTSENNRKQLIEIVTKAYEENIKSKSN